MNSSLNTVIALGKTYSKELESIAEDELLSAASKWKILLSDEQKTLVKEKAFEQLKNKIKFCYGAEYDFEDSINACFSGANGSYTIPSKEASECEIVFIRSNAGWCVDQNKDSDSLPMRELPDSLKADFEKWIRTAVFYGVGSLKD